MRLLNPGPVTLTDEVREAQLGPDLCHRQPEYAALQQEVREGLERVYPEAAGRYASVLLTGSGTAAVECMIDSLAKSNGKTLVVANGVYGERIASILEIHGKPFQVVSSEWTRPIDLVAVKRLLATDKTITHVATVHHETTTGRLNDLAALGGLCGRYAVPLLLDAVSSFGGEPIQFDEWNLAACAATANKCLHAVPGTAFVLARRDVLETGGSQASSLYLDLFRHWRSQEQGSTQFTPAVQSMYALRTALSELHQDGGWRTRHAHYAALSARLRGSLKKLGFSLLLEKEGVYSSTLTSFNLPPGIAFDALYASMSDRGFVIYPGQKELQTRIFRIAVMGDLTMDDIDEFTDGVASLRDDRVSTPELACAD
jgi:2-aminoethylphosphonate-pyruvate transaminase